MSELIMQMHKHRKGFWDLTEFDKDWINPATRKDIETIAEQHNFEVFGLHMWNPWTKIRGKDLIDVGNFGVDYIFKNCDEAEVNKIIANYKNKEENWSMELVVETVNRLDKLAIYACVWQ